MNPSTFNSDMNGNGIDLEGLTLDEILDHLDDIDLDDLDDPTLYEGE